MRDSLSGRATVRHSVAGGFDPRVPHYELLDGPVDRRPLIRGVAAFNSQ